MRTEFTLTEMQAILSVFTDEIVRLDQEDMGGWDVTQYIGYSVYTDIVEKATKAFDSTE
jgi:hypothetical protein